MNKINNKIELLSPAGDWERMEMAVAYGADAVYLAGDLFGMRSYAGNFPEGVLSKAIAFCHERGVKVYVTCNTMPRNDEVEQLPRWLEYIESVGADGVIVADLGVLAMAKKYAPSVEIHISTQASIVNYGSAMAFYEMGASRVVLARELSMEDIITLRKHVPPELELEVFVHGAMCMSYSGRCLLSSFMTGRDANRGACAQPCRYQYALVEEKRGGEAYTIIEEAGETFILNSRDMCMIDHVGALIEAGVTSLKIEGRAKSAYYAGVVTGAYRQAVDAALAGTPLDPIWRDEVEHISHRDYSTGFFFGEPGQFVKNSGYVCHWQIVAFVKECDENGLGLLTLRNKFAVGEEVELVGPNCKPVSFVVGELVTEEGETVEEVRNPQMLFRLQLPCVAPPLSMLRRKENCSPNPST